MKLLLAGLLATVLLTGCGDAEESAREAYCSALRDKLEVFGEMANSQDPTALMKRLSTLEDLGKQAPADLADEWQVFLNAVRDLDQAVREAKTQPGAAQPKAVKDAADQLASEEVVGAANSIEQHARDVCHLQLGL